MISCIGRRLIKELACKHIGPFRLPSRSVEGHTLPREILHDAKSAAPSIMVYRPFNSKRRTRGAPQLYHRVYVKNETAWEDVKISLVFPSVEMKIEPKVGLEILGQATNSSSTYLGRNAWIETSTTWRENQ